MKAFLNRRFNEIPRPSFLQSIQVTSFNFGSIAPEIEIIDITDPYADYYENYADEDGQTPDENRDLPSGPTDIQSPDEASSSRSETTSADTQLPRYSMNNSGISYPMSPLFPSMLHQGWPYSPIRAGLATTGMPHVRRSPLNTTIPPPQYTPMRDTQRSGRVKSLDNHRPSSGFDDDTIYSVDANNDTSASGTSPPPPTPSRERRSHLSSSPISLSLDPILDTSRSDRVSSWTPDQNIVQPRTEDMQVEMVLKYEGNCKIGIAAELIINSPTPNFLTLPLKLNLTNLSFAGNAMIAFIRNQIFFSLVEKEVDSTPVEMLRDIKIESEIGDADMSVLKNVGLVEKFLLQEGRRLILEELVFPSFVVFIR